MYALLMYYNTIMRISVSAESSLTDVVSQVSEVETKPHYGTDDSDFIFFDTGFDSVTMTEPGLPVQYFLKNESLDKLVRTG